MSCIVRKQWIGALTPGADVSAALPAVEAALQQAVVAGQVMTAGLFRHSDVAFFYAEGIDEAPCVEALLSALDPWLLTLPTPFGAVKWREMERVFCHAHPIDTEDWRRKSEPELRYGALAILKDGFMPTYVQTHVGITSEGHLDGDKYLSIALYDHMLFSYNESPRVMCNIARDLTLKSEAVMDWVKVGPRAHFIPWPDIDEAHYDHFHPIDTLVLVHQ